jgi:hypothetical protein
MDLRLVVELSLLERCNGQQVSYPPNLVLDIGGRIVSQAIQFELE